MNPLVELPVAIQTSYADLVQRAWTGNLANLAGNVGGSPYVREVRGRRYWYWRTAVENGKRPSPRYLGPDGDQTRARIQAMQDHVENLRQRRDMVRALRAARLPIPDAMSGDIMAALAEAGVFRLRAAVIGSVAFQTYPGMLGCHLPATLSRTGDLDIGQFHSIVIAVEDAIDQDFEAVLKKVDTRFEAVPDPTDGRRTLRYALRIGGDERFSVDVLSPMRGPDRSKIEKLSALRSDAQLLRYLDFLFYQEVNSVALHGAGIPINVPDPTRYALHKLIVAQMRHQDIARSAAKSRKDLQQAEALIGVLARQRPDDLRDMWQELCDRGPSWRSKAQASLATLPDWVSDAVGASKIPLKAAEEDADESSSELANSPPR
jgi:hypothetical protein